MNLTHDYLIKIGYQCNEDGTYTKSVSMSSGIPHPKPQPNPRLPLVSPQKREESRKARTTLIVTRCAFSLLDADNFAGGCKFLIDQLRYAKLIKDDDPETIEILFRQVKVKTSDEEMTKVEITQSCGDFKRGDNDLVKTSFD